MFQAQRMLSYGVNFLLCCGLAVAIACSTDPPRVLRAGAAMVEVTPPEFPVVVNCMFLPRTADHGADPLRARAVVLDDGRGPIAIVVVDSCMLPRELIDDAKQLASRTTGIAPERMLVSATHTHSAPAAMGCLGTDPDPAYQAFLPPKIAAAIEQAAGRMTPARVGWSSVEAPEHTFCRRWLLRPDRTRLDPFGERTIRANTHDLTFQDPNFVGPSGPVDPELSLLSVQSLDGRPLALLANFSMHYVTGAAYVTADYFGRFAQEITELIGAPEQDPPFVAIMSQGTSGDLQWMDYRLPRKPIDVNEYARELAEIAHGAYPSIEHHDWVPIAMGERTLRLSRRLPSPKRLTWAKQIVSGMQGRGPANKEEIYAREQLFLAEEPERELKLQALRIGDLGITAIPNEVYSITGLKLKAQSPLQPTFNISLANGAEGYIPPPEQHRLGGYTTFPARTAGLEVQAEPKIVATLLELLEEVSGSSRRPPADHNGPYAQAVLGSQPIAFWRFNELQGSEARDASGRQHHGLYQDGVAYYLEGPRGQFSDQQINRAVHFAGGRMTAAAMPLVPPYSVELWFYNVLPPDARPVTGYLISRSSSAGQSGCADSLSLGGNTGNAGRLFFASANNGQSGKTAVALHSWHHVVLVRDTDSAKVYLNGRTEPEISTAAPGPPKTSLDELVVAGCRGSEATFEGKLDEVAVYDRALTGEEVATHYRAAAVQ